MVKIKICGITNKEDADYCSSLGVDALGFIFYKRSPRYIHPSKAKEIISSLDPFIVKVGVFVDEKKDVVEGIANDLKLDVLQFHGNESPRLCTLFKKRSGVVKSLFLESIHSFGDITKYTADAFLFDVKWEEKQKGRKALKKSMLRKIGTYGNKIRIIISGGLTAQNVVSVLDIVKPYAVDVASGVESFPGKKDKTLLKTFVKRVRSYAHSRY
jgi:phosphoribosylanthranilate isomerase